MKAGSDVEMGRCDDDTALTYAAEGGHTKIVRLLLKAGAADYHEKLNVRALNLAKNNGHKTCVKLLTEAGIIDK